MPAFAAALIPLLLLPLPGAAPTESRYRWPVTPPQVLRRFEPPPERWLPGHRGVDLGSAPGTRVRSAGAGVVIHAQTLAGRGVVSVLHAGGLRTTYEPVTATVQAGDRVAAGGPIGVLETGHPGCPVAACLHWGLRRGDVYLDPLALFGLGRVRLLPLG
jgi:murein DD-endopeptidase MepM/ murein hydrolase activator NlpD